MLFTNTNQLNLQQVPKLFGLIGYPLGHSFSKRHFSSKFAKERLLDCHYELFPLREISEFSTLKATYPNLQGLNVTIPFKTSILPLLDEVDEVARSMGAVNTIQFVDGKTKGWNTDYLGFLEGLQPIMNRADWRDHRALVLGLGGASRAVVAALTQLNMQVTMVGRHAEDARFKDIMNRFPHTVIEYIGFESLKPQHIENARLIVQTTPLGMHPNNATFPKISYEDLSTAHVLYDLVYNPEKTVFLTYGEQQGATTLGGLPMLYHQAQHAWKIWNALPS